MESQKTLVFQPAYSDHICPDYFASNPVDVNGTKYRARCYSRWSSSQALETTRLQKWDLCPYKGSWEPRKIDLPSRSAHCLLLVSTWKRLKNTSLHYSITVGLLALPNSYFQMCITGDALLRKVKTNMVYTTLFTCNVKLLQSRYRHELKIFLLRNRLGLNIPDDFHTRTPELKYSERVWFRSGILYRSSFWNSCGQMCPRFNHCHLLLLLVLLWGLLARELLGLYHCEFQ